MSANAQAARERHLAPAPILAGILLALTLLFLGRGLLLSPDRILAGSDTRILFVPWLATLRAGVAEGRLPLWEPYLFSGYPFFSDPEVGVFYPPAWLSVIFPINIGLSLYTAFHVWMAGVGMLALARRLGLNWLGAMLSALTFAFNGFITARIDGGHIGLVGTHIWIPWILVACEWSVRRGDVWSGIVAGIPFALSILAGNVPSLVYVGLIWLAFGLYLGLDGRGWRRVGRQMATAGIVGAAISAVQTIPVAEFASLSTRVGATLEEFGARWSLPPFHLITLLNPIYFGGPEEIGYWSVPDFVDLTYYAGILPLIAFPLILRRPDRLAWWLVALAVFGLLMALGTYGFLYPIVYTLLPVFRLVRGPARAAFLFVFAGSLALGASVSSWEDVPGEERAAAARGLLRWVLLVLGAICLVGLVSAGTAFTLLHDVEETSGRLWHQAGGWMWALLVVVSGGALLWGYLTTSSEQKQPARRIIGVALAVTVTADLWFFGYRLITLEPLMLSPIWAAARNAIGPTDQRVVPWAVQPYDHNDAVLARTPSVLGINPLEIGNYRNFVESVADPRAATYDILAVEYVISPNPLEDQFLTGERPLSVLETVDSVWIYHRARVLPLARMTYDIMVINSPQDTVNMVHEPEFDPTTTVILNQTPPCNVQPGTGTATIAEHRPEYWRIETDSDAPGILVLSETAYPGWHVTVDGQPASSLTAYSVIRAVCVPEGRHTVEWVFDPVSRKIGIGVSLAALIVTTFAGIMIWRRRPAASPSSS